LRFPATNGGSDPLSRQQALRAVPPQVGPCWLLYPIVSLPYAAGHTMQASQTLLRNNRGSLAALGYGVAGVVLLAIVALLHHPVGYGRQSLEILASIQSQARVDQLVHAVLAAVYCTLAWRIGPTGRRQPHRDLRRPSCLVPACSLIDDFAVRSLREGCCLKTVGQPRSRPELLVLYQPPEMLNVAKP